MASEQDNPDFYLAHKDDDVWEEGEVVTRRSARRLGAVVSVRFAPEELEMLRRESPDGNLSRLIRERVLGEPAPTEDEPSLTTSLDLRPTVRPVARHPVATSHPWATLLPSPAPSYSVSREQGADPVRISQYR